MLHIQVYTYLRTVFNSKKIRKFLNVYKLRAWSQNNGTLRHSTLSKNYMYSYLLT